MDEGGINTQKPKKSSMKAKQDLNDTNPMSNFNDTFVNHNQLDVSLESSMAEQRRKTLKDIYEIVSITFAEQDNYETELLMEMYPIDKAIKEQLSFAKDKNDPEYIRFMKFYQQQLKNLKLKYKDYLKNKTENP